MSNHAFHDIASYNCISSYPIISLWTNFNISLWFIVVSSTCSASLSPLSIQTSPASPVPPWGDGASSSGACGLAELGAGFFSLAHPKHSDQKNDELMWIDVNRCESMWIDVNWCELMWIDVNWCELMWIDVNWCGLMWTDVDWCGLMWTDVNWCELMWTDVNWCELMWTDVNWCELMWTDVNWCELMWTDVNWCELMWIDVNWCELMWIDVNWCELMWIDVNWCELLWIELMWIELMWIDVNWCELMWIDVNRCELMWIDVNWCELWSFFVKSVFHALSFKTRHQVEVTWIPFDFEHPRWISESLFGAAKSCSHRLVCIIRFLQRSEHRPEQTDSPKVLD